MAFLSGRTAMKAAVLIIAVTSALYALSSGPPYGFTGGLGPDGEREPTCVLCHGSFGLDSGRDRGGDFYIDRVPETYVPGEVYELSVVIFHPDQRRWGFQLSARDENGIQAGSFELIDTDNTAINPFFEDIQYVQQTRVGTMEGVVTGPVYWSVNWTAPDEDVGPVYFNAAGLAANGDGSPEGDYVYTTEQISVAQLGGTVPTKDKGNE